MRIQAGVKILKRREDIRSILTVLLSIGCSVTFALLQPTNLVLRILAILVSWILCFICCLITHNHKHFSVFENPVLNRIFDLLLSIAVGRSSASIVIPHNLNHHVYSNTEQDWIRASLAGRGWGPVRWVRFVVLAIREMSRKRRAWPMPHSLAFLQTQRRYEQVTVILFFAGMVFTAGLTSTLLFIGLPWLLGLCTLVGANLFQHDGIAQESEWPARDFTSPLLNFFLFNNGYHIAHHLFPTLHWADLPQYTQAELRVPKEFSQRSFLQFFCRFYLLSRN